MSGKHSVSVKDLPDRLHVSPGVSVVRPQRTIFGSQLVYGMYVPRDDWRAVTKHDLEAALTSGILDEILLVRPLPQMIEDLREVVHAFRETNGDAHKSLISGITIPPALAQATLDSALGHEAGGTRMITAVIRYFAIEAASGSAPGTRQNAQGSTTFYPGAEKAMGLHIDTWAHRRDYAGSGTPFRCIVNIGREARHMVFVNLRQPEISRMIGQAHPDIDAPRLLDDNPIEWGQRLLAAYPDLPMIRLTILPGEAYVMNTHACIHDGWTLHRTSPDVFAILSYIKDPS